MSKVQKMKDKAHKSPKSPKHIKFKCSVNNDFEDIVAHNDVVDFIEKDRHHLGWSLDIQKDSDSPEGKAGRQEPLRIRCKLSCSMEHRRTDLGALM